MSRLNYLTDEELALVGIAQDLRLLERLIADGIELNVMQLKTLANYGDRISRLVAPKQNLAAAGGNDLQPIRSASSRTKQAIEPSIKTKELRQSIQQFLDQAIE